VYRGKLPTQRGLVRDRHVKVRDRRPKVIHARERARGGWVGPRVTLCRPCEILTGGAQKRPRVGTAGTASMKGVMSMNTRQAGPELRRHDGEPVRVLVVDDEPTLTDLL
jgi:hypothetical protein